MPRLCRCSLYYLSLLSQVFCVHSLLLAVFCLSLLSQSSVLVFCLSLLLAVFCFSLLSQVFCVHSLLLLFCLSKQSCSVWLYAVKYGNARAIVALCTKPCNHHRGISTLVLLISLVTLIMSAGSWWSMMTSVLSAAAAAAAVFCLSHSCCLDSMMLVVYFMDTTNLVRECMRQRFEHMHIYQVFTLIASLRCLACSF